MDTFFAGTLKGVGKVCIQTVLDCFSRFVWARLHTFEDARLRIPLISITDSGPFRSPVPEDSDHLG